MNRIVIILFISILVVGCNSENTEKAGEGKEIVTQTSPGETGYTAGKLEYQITYLNAEEDGYDPMPLPQVMTLEFNQDFCINTIDGFMGMFKLSNIIYFKNQEVLTHLKYFDKNFAYLGGHHDIMCCFDSMEGMEVTHDTTITKMAGLDSRRAIISFPDRPDTFSVYYTYDINLPDPNGTNPYHKIDGALTGFRLSMGQYKMEFTAVKFDTAKAPTEEFRFPEGTYRVKREYLVSILSQLMSEV
jgi:hypothetical protein